MQDKSIIFIFGYLLYCALSTAQVPHFFTYNSTEGLPQSQVWTALSDTRGFMWFGTQGGGLSRFDGTKFETYTTSDGLVSDFVHCVIQDRDYRLWIGTEKGLCSYNGQRFTTFPTIKNAINSLYADSINQRLYVGTNNGLFSIDLAMKTPRVQPILKSTSIFCFLGNETGIWAGTSEGLYRIDGEESVFFNKKNGIIGQGVYAISEGAKNELILGLWGFGIARYSIHNQSVTKKITHRLLLRPQSIFRNKGAQNYWVGTQDKGLVLLGQDLDEVQQVSERDGLPHNNVKTIVEDGNNQLWVATSGGGVARSLRQNFKHFTKQNGLAGERIYAVAEDNKGQLWLSASNRGIQIKDSSGFSAIPLPERLQNVKCKTICSDRQGRMWIGTEGQGIIVIEDRWTNESVTQKSEEVLFDSLQIEAVNSSRRWKFSSLNTANGLPENWVQHIICDENGQMWVALFNRGIIQANLDSEGSFTVSSIKNDENLSPRNTISLCFDNQNRLWFGTMNGQVGFIEKNKILRVYGTEAGLTKAPIRSLIFDKKNRLWIGTKGAGVYRALDSDNTNFEPLNTAKHLSSKNIYLLLNDRNGTIWAGNERGVDKLLLDKKGAVQSVFSYGRKEGFLGMETCHNAALHDRKGQLWFGTMNGLMRLVPQEEQQVTKAAEVHIEEVSLFYKPIGETEYSDYVHFDGSLRNGLVLPYNKNHLSFSFKAVDLENPERLRYRWKLENAETKWSPPSNQQSVNYANLQAGIYTFKVQAGSDDGSWGAIKQVRFEISKAFWETFSFRLIVGSCLAAILGLIVWVWMRSVKRKEAAQRQELEVQNKVLQLEQKALQLQMNPHFIFNALTGIRSLITEKDFNKARSELNEFAKLMRSVLNNSRRTYINLKEEADTLEKYLSIEQFCHDGKFDFSIKMPNDIDPEEVELPPMLLQPFVENAVVHGVSHLSYKGHIFVVFEVEKDLLKCTIRDNGIGREKAARLQAEKQPGHQSIALKVTKERLTALQGKLMYKNLEINDLQSKNMSGTEVVVRLPLQFNF